MPTFWPRGRDSRITDMMRKTSVAQGSGAATATFAAVGDALRSAKQSEEDGLLRVQALFGLVEDDRLRSVEHRVGDLGVAMRGQAVHENSMRLRVGHEGFVDLVGLEDR